MYLYTEANENVQAYAIGSHRHTPEIEQELSALAGSPVRVSFTPHLVPLNRGLLTTASVPLASALGTADLLRVYRDFYAGEAFVRVVERHRESGVVPTTVPEAGELPPPAGPTPVAAASVGANDAR